MIARSERRVRARAGIENGKSVAVKVDQDQGLGRMGDKGKYVLVTGGTGYVGSHVVLELLNSGKYIPVVVDNLENSSPESLRRVEKLSGERPAGWAILGAFSISAPGNT